MRGNLQFTDDRTVLRKGVFAFPAYRHQGDDWFASPKNYTPQSNEGGFAMKRVFASIIIVTLIMLFTLFIGVHLVNAQGSMMDQGKALLDKGKATEQSAPAATAPTAGTDASSGQAATTQGQGTLTGKAKALMDQGGMIDKAKGMMNQDK